jgi:hypothetical protein
MAVTSTVCGLHTLHHASRRLTILIIMMASIPSQLLPCMYDSSLSRWIMLFYLFVYWQSGEIPDYSHYHQPHISLKMLHFSRHTETLPQFRTDLNSYWFSARHLSFITLNFKPKGDNAIIHAWTLRGRQWPFERCRKFINGADVGHGSCSACVVTLKGKHRSTWTNFVSRSGTRLSQGYQNLFKRIRSIEIHIVFEDKAEKPNSVTHTCVISETKVAA